MKVWLDIHKTKILAVLILLVISIFFYFSHVANNEEIIIGETSASLLNDQKGEESPKDKEVHESIDMMVDVKGAIINPGVYHAIQGERVIDLIQKAGGFMKEADQNQVNLSEHIVDEMVIFVPLWGEEGEISQVGNSVDKKQSSLININKATESELQTLPGIGPAKAQSIIEYRETNGGFSSIDDLKKISGIGEKTFEKLEALISVK